MELWETEGPWEVRVIVSEGGPSSDPHELQNRSAAGTSAEQEGHCGMIGFPGIGFPYFTVRRQ